MAPVSAAVAVIGRNDAGNQRMAHHIALRETRDADPLDALQHADRFHEAGFLTREAFLSRYAERSGRDVSQVMWYEVLGHFKLAVIVLQIFARYRLGQTQDPRFAPLAGQARWLIGEAWRRVTETAQPSSLTARDE
mgnify:CR=1 FL=1